MAQAACGQVLVTLLPTRYRPLVTHALRKINNAFILFYSLYCFMIFCRMKHGFGWQSNSEWWQFAKIYTDQSLTISADGINETKTLHTVATTSSVTVHIFRPVYSQRAPPHSLRLNSSMIFRNPKSQRTFSFSDLHVGLVDWHIGIYAPISAIILSNFFIISFLICVVILTIILIAVLQLSLILSVCFLMVLQVSSEIFMALTMLAVCLLYSYLIITYM